MSEYLAKRFDLTGPPPEGLNPDDLAVWLLRHMGVGWSEQNGIAAADALWIKSTEPGQTPSTAYMFILKRWSEYKASEHYRSQYRRKAAGWLTEGDYNNPASWGDFSEIHERREAAKPKPVNKVEMWARDKREHPEKYFTREEEANFWKQVMAGLKEKRMPDAETSADDA